MSEITYKTEEAFNSKIKEIGTKQITNKDGSKDTDLLYMLITLTNKTYNSIDSEGTNYIFTNLSANSSINIGYIYDVSKDPWDVGVSYTLKSLMGDEINAGDTWRIKIPSNRTPSNYLKKESCYSSIGNLYQQTNTYVYDFANKEVITMKFAPIASEDATSGVEEVSNATIEGGETSSKNDNLTEEEIEKDTELKDLIGLTYKYSDENLDGLYSVLQDAKHTQYLVNPANYYNMYSTSSTYIKATFINNEDGTEKTFDSIKYPYFKNFSISDNGVKTLTLEMFDRDFGSSPGYSPDGDSDEKSLEYYIKHAIGGFNHSTVSSINSETNSSDTNSSEGTLEEQSSLESINMDTLNDSKPNLTIQFGYSDVDEFAGSLTSNNEKVIKAYQDSYAKLSGSSYKDSSDDTSSKRNARWWNTKNSASSNILTELDLKETESKDSDGNSYYSGGVVTNKNTSTSTDEENLDYISRFQSSDQSTKDSYIINFIITGFKTSITSAGLEYKITAIESRNYELLKYKFVQRYGYIEGTPKKVFRSIAKAINKSNTKNLVDSGLQICWLNQDYSGLSVDGTEIYQEVNTDTLKKASETIGKNDLWWNNILAFIKNNEKYTTGTGNFDDNYGSSKSNISIINSLYPYTRLQVCYFIEALAIKKIDVKLDCGKRNFALQALLYSIGRLKCNTDSRKGIFDSLCSYAGTSATNIKNFYSYNSSDTAYNFMTNRYSADESKCVSWTLKSNHILGCAFDVKNFTYEGTAYTPEQIYNAIYNIKPGKIKKFGKSPSSLIDEEKYTDNIYKLINILNSTVYFINDSNDRDANNRSSRYIQALGGWFGLSSIEKSNTVGINYYISNKTKKIGNSLNFSYGSTNGTVTFETDLINIINLKGSELESETDTTIYYKEALKNGVKWGGTFTGVSIDPPHFESIVSQNRNKIFPAYDSIPTDGWTAYTTDEENSSDKITDAENAATTDDTSSLKTDEYIKKININLGGEDAYYNFHPKIVNGRQEPTQKIYKSFSSLFDEYCSACPPYKVYAGQLSNVYITDPATGDTSKYQNDNSMTFPMTWDILGKIKESNDANKTGRILIGFHYKKPIYFQKIRDYAWGPGYSGVTTVVSLNIETENEFSTLSAYSVFDAGDTADENGSKESYYSRDAKVEGANSQLSDENSSSIICNDVYRTETEDNKFKYAYGGCMYKGTMVVLGDPFFEFVGVVQPYTLPIHISIYYPKNNNEWSSSSSSSNSNRLSPFSGYYVVTGITHSISSSGYTTTLNISSYPGIINQIFYSAAKKSSESKIGQETIAASLSGETKKGEKKIEETTSTATSTTS